MYNPEDNPGKYPEGVNDEAHGYSAERKNGDHGTCVPVGRTQIPFRMNEVATDYNMTDINNYQVDGTARSVEVPSVFPAAQNSGSYFFGLLKRLILIQTH